MSKSPNDSAEVIEFMKLFARLKEWTDNEAEGLLEFARKDESIQELCVQVHWSASFLRMHERKHRQLFATPVNPDFINAWRDYENRFEDSVARVWSEKVLPDFNESKIEEYSKLSELWNHADSQGAEEANGITEIIEFATFNADQEDRWSDQPEFLEALQEGLSGWKKLDEHVGVNLRGIFRRRALVPFVLVPRKLANKSGSTETASLLNQLQQAHDAFVFGAPFAALALMRSITEVVLRDHYSAQGEGLEALINIASRKLPRAASAAALHRLRRHANAILHFNHEKARELRNMNEEQLEKELFSLLLAVRALIEGVR